MTWHPKAQKDLKALDKPIQKQVLSTIDSLVNREPTTLAQTHPLTGPLKGWTATKVSRGHRITHQMQGDTLHIGHIGLHNYDDAIRRLTTKEDVDDLLDLIGGNRPSLQEPTEDAKAEAEAEHQQRVKAHREWQAARPGLNPGEDIGQHQMGKEYPHAEWVPIEVAKHFREHAGDWNPDSEKKVQDLTEQFKSGRGTTDPLMLLHHNEAHRASLGEGNHRLKAMENAGWSHVPMRVVRMYDGEADRGKGQPIPHQWQGTHRGRTPEVCKPSDVLAERLFTHHKQATKDDDYICEGAGCLPRSVGEQLPDGTYTGLCVSCQEFHPMTEIIPPSKPTYRREFRLAPHPGPPRWWLKESRVKHTDAGPDGEPATGIMVAIVPPKRVSKDLEIPDGEPHDRMHVTLAYLGNIEEYSAEMLQDLPEIVAAWAETQPQTSAKTQGAGTFVPATEGGKHVLWAAVDIPGVNRMHRSLMDMLKDRGYQPHEDHEFHPHLTLGYSKYHWRFIPKIRPDSWKVREVWTVVGGTWESHPIG